MPSRQRCWYAGIGKGKILFEEFILVGARTNISMVETYILLLFIKKLSLNSVCNNIPWANFCFCQGGTWKKPEAIQCSLTVR